MKKMMLAIILSAFALTVTGCNNRDYNDLLTEPQYDLAEYRSEIGNLFYETEDKVGITTSFGFFIYSLDEDKLISAFDLDETKAFGEDFFADARLSKDEKSIYLFGYSHEKTVDDYFYRYDLENGNLYKEEETFDENELYPLPDQNRTALKTTSWKAEDLAYFRKDSGTPYYPFKDID
ncbi:hypothetical protein [Proteiniclasticum sp.]|uniref:hypothetical protein n=1 Tax=Proteiniclasticum sp. TaxID=2053595 RepID=UPI00289BBEA2|nr:hypothetical protein [Proteiniclasticum sp.]